MTEKKYYVFLSPLKNGNKPFLQLMKIGFMDELSCFAQCKTKNKNGEISEPDVIALKFGFAEMINEAIDIQNEKNEIKEEAVTLKQVGRIITEIGFSEMTGI